MAKARVFAKACGVLAVVACVASLAACKSPEEIQHEQDQADEQRCVSMGIAATPGDPQYVQCRMWAAEMRQQAERDRRQAWLAALAAYGAMQQQPRGPAYQAPLYGYGGGAYDDEPPPQPRWIVPPSPPPTTWCRPVGRWMSCTGQ